MSSHRRMVVTILSLSVALGWIACWHGTASAQRDGVATSRTVGGHEFSEIEAAAWPFVTPRVSSVTGFGLATFEGRSEALAIDFEGDFASFREEFTAAFAANDWLGFEISLLAGVFGGTDQVGALVVGANGGITAGAAAVVRLLETDRVYLAARVDAEATQAEGLGPSRIVDTIGSADGEVRFRELPLSDLGLQYDGNVLSTAGTIAAAIGLGRSFGVMTSVALGWERFDVADSVDNVGVLAGGIALSLELIELAGVPLQTVAGARLAWDFGADDDAQGVLLSAVLPAEDLRVEPELGVFYTARPELDLGVTVTSVLSDEDDRIRLNMHLGYFW